MSQWTSTRIHPRVTADSRLCPLRSIHRLHFKRFRIRAGRQRRAQLMGQDREEVVLGRKGPLTSAQYTLTSTSTYRFIWDMKGSAGGFDIDGICAPRSTRVAGIWRQEECSLCTPAIPSAYLTCDIGEMARHYLSQRSILASLSRERGRDARTAWPVRFMLSMLAVDLENC